MITNIESKVLTTLAKITLLGLIPFLIYSRLHFTSSIWFLYGTFIVYLNFIFLAKFLAKWRNNIYADKGNRGGFPISLILKYLLIGPLLYAGIRVAPEHIFAIISGAIWTNFAFIITIIITLKERS